MTSLSPEDIKLLEQTRQRLSQLSNSLSSLQQQLLNSDPLPPWYARPFAQLRISCLLTPFLFVNRTDNCRSSLHSLSQIISQNLTSVSSLQTSHTDILSSLVIYPLPTYPGRDQENLLHQLLRKKLEPQVEDWVEEGRAIGAELSVLPGGKARIEELWEWAGMAANEQARKHEWGGEFTIEEIEKGVENVRTGLQGQMGDDESEEDVDEEEEGRQGREVLRPLGLDAVLRYLAKGEEPGKEEKG